MKNTIVLNTRPATEAAILLMQHDHHKLDFVIPESQDNSYTLTAGERRATLSLSELVKALFEAQKVHVL